MFSTHETVNLISQSRIVYEILKQNSHCKRGSHSTFQDLTFSDWLHWFRNMYRYRKKSLDTLSVLIVLEFLLKSTYRLTLSPTHATIQFAKKTEFCC